MRDEIRQQGWFLQGGLLAEVNGWRAPPGPEPRIGVVGCGYWGAKHVRVLSGLAAVKDVTVIDSDQKNLDAIRSAFPAVRAFSDVDAGLRHVDALIIATPPQSHAQLALEALRAGKHVLIEKPLATCAEDARALVQEAERQDRILMAGHTFEFNPAVIELRRRLQRGDLGDVYYVHSSRLNLGLFRRDVNVVWDLAPHDISILNYILGSFPTAVTAWGLSHAGAEAEVLAYLRLEYEDIGVTGYVHVSWLDPKKVRKVVVVGSERMAVYDDVAEERLRIYDRGVEFEEASPASHERPLCYRYGDILSPHIQFEEPLLLEDRHFVECIRTGARPQCDGLSGLQVVMVLEAADRSLRAGGAVRVGIENDVKRLFPHRRIPVEVRL
jgi:predicted dehydrogenase